MLLLALAGLAACEGGDNSAAEPADAVKAITGQVMYRERMILPPAAEVTVEFQDISRADAPASTLATVMMPASAGPPYDFSIDYSPRDIDPRHRYALRATITLDDRLMFTSTDYIDPFAGGPIEIMVRRVQAVEESTHEQAALPLEGTQWTLNALEGVAAVTGAGGRVPDLLLEADSQRAAGFSGCNQYGGPYRRDDASSSGGQLSLGPLAGTLMACAEGGELERAYLDALGAVDGFRIAGDRLTLLSGDAVVASFRGGAGQ
nr:YbaY family lipoprotein [Parahaliea mediterranea]